MKYKEIKKINKKEFQEKEAISDPERLSLLLYGISEVDDWRWAQGIYYKYLVHPNKWVSVAAIKGLADLARTSRKLDKDKVYKRLKEIAKTNIDLRDIVEDTIDDIELFVKDSNQ